VVVSESVTDCAELNVPGAGEKVGVAATGILIVYVPVATALLAKPEATAIALIVVVDETAMGVEDEYSVDAVVGVDPLVV
jgi:hypothetical protein